MQCHARITLSAVISVVLDIFTQIEYKLESPEAQQPRELVAIDLKLTSHSRSPMIDETMLRGGKGAQIESSSWSGNFQ